MFAFLAGHWFLVLLAIGLGSALLAPGPLRPVMDYWEPRRTIAVSLFLVAWTMPTESLIAEIRRPAAALWAVLISYGIVPAAAWGIGTVAPDAVQIGLILASTVPCTLSSAVLWTRLAGGNEATALLTVMGTVFSSWLLTTAWLFALTGAVVELDIQAMALDLTLSLIVPVLMGQGLRFFKPCARFAERHKRLLGALSQCFILAIVVKAGIAVGEKLHQDNAWEAPAIFLWSIVLAGGLHSVAVVIGFWSSRWLGLDRGRQIAVAFASSQKTLPLGLVLYEQYFKTQFPYAVMPLLFYHVGQLLIDTVIARRLHQSEATRPKSAPDDLPFVPFAPSDL